MGLLKNFKWWKKIVIISCKYHIIRSLLPLLLTSARAYHGSPLYCNVLQCNVYCTDCSARFSVESYNQIIIFPFPDNIFLPFLSQLCKRGEERERGESAVSGRGIWYCYDPHCCSFNPKLIISDSLASKMTEIHIVSHSIRNNHLCLKFKHVDGRVNDNQKNK